jgi:hypothetical protein
MEEYDISLYIDGSPDSSNHSKTVFLHFLSLDCHSPASPMTSSQGRGVGQIQAISLFKHCTTSIFHILGLHVHVFSPYLYFEIANSLFPHTLKYSDLEMHEDLTVTQYNKEDIPSFPILDSELDSTTPASSTFATPSTIDSCQQYINMRYQNNYEITTNSSI